MVRNVIKISGKMRKILVNLLLLSCFTAVNSAPKVELNLKAVVYPQLNIERVDNNGDIDLFSRTESQYRIISNHDGDVKVTVSTVNGWKAKKISEDEGGEGKEIPYRALFKSADKEEGLHSEKNDTVVKKESFKDKKYEFRLIFYSEKSISEYSAGTYTDTITVNISAV